MIDPFHAAYYEMETDEKDRNRVVELVEKINNLQPDCSGHLYASEENGVVIVYFTGYIEKFSAYCLYELIRKLASYSTVDSILSMTSPDDVKHLIFKDHSSDPVCANAQHHQIVRLSRTLALGIKSAV